MSDEIRVRPARAEDFDEIVTIIRKVAASQNRSDQVQVTPEQLVKDSGLQSGSPKLFDCVVAVRRSGIDSVDQLVGYVTWYYGFTSWEGKNAYLDELYLEEPYKDTELAGRLLSHVAKDTRKESSVWLRFFVCNSDRKTIEIYKALGAQNVTAKYDYDIWSFDQHSLRQMAECEHSSSTGQPA